MDLIDIARLEEARRCTLASTVAELTRPITNGGVALRGPAGTWINYAVGLGLNGSVPREELEAISEWYTSAGLEPRFEVAPFADRALFTDLEDLGFRLRMIGSIFFRVLGPDERVRPVHEPPPDLSIRTVDPDKPAEVREYLRVSMSGFHPPGYEPSEKEYDLGGRAVRQRGTICMAAHLDGRVVGAGFMNVQEKVAALLGLTVLPEYRRRGVQQALIAARLNLAVARGVGLATIGSLPGAGTERNVRRMGFELGYMKVTLVRPGPGLARVRMA